MRPRTGIRRVGHAPDNPHNVGETKMRQLRMPMICALVVAMACVALRAQEAKAPPDDAKDVRARIDAANKERRLLFYKLSAIRRKVERSEAVADLRRAADEADKAAREAEAKNPAIVEARKAERAAMEAMRKALDDALKANPETAALMRELAELEESRATLSFRVAMADLKLTHRDSPVSRALDKDKTLAELRRAAERVRDRAKRTEALKAHKDARSAAMKTIPEAMALIEEIEAAKEGIAEAVKAADAARTKLLRLRGSLGRDRENKALEAARERLRDANKAVHDTYDTPALKAAAEARSTAHRALYEKVKELVAKDPDGAAMSARMEELEKKIRDLHGKNRPRPNPGRRRKPEPEPEA